VIDTSTDTVTITAAKHIELKAPEGDIRLQSKQVLIAASEGAEITADKMTIGVKHSLALKGDPIDLN